MSTYVLRDAEMKDCVAIDNLFKEFTHSEGQSNNYINTVKKLEEDGFGDRPWYNCIVIERVNKANKQVLEIVGFIMYAFSYDGWRGRVVYVTDLFITEKHRGFNLGKVLIQRMTLNAARNGCVRMEMAVYNKHESLRNYYKTKIGLTDFSSDVPNSRRLNFFAMSGDAFQGFVKEAESDYNKYGNMIEV